MIFIMKKINTISRSAVTYRNDKLDDKSLSPLFHSYVFIISKHPGISQEELSNELCINKSNVTRGLTNLEDMGYIRRESDKVDKRVMRVFPTEKMLEELPKIRGILRSWNEYLTEDIDNNEIEIFQSVLERISNKAKQYMENREEK